VQKSALVLAAFFLAVCEAMPAGSYVIEERAKTKGAWETRNRYRIVVDARLGDPTPLLVRTDLPQDFSPATVRVIDGATRRVVPAKTEWHVPEVRIAWRPTGARSYEVYFDRKGQGETESLTEPAMVGAGDKMTYGRAGARANLGAGLHPHPCPIDFDNDGKMDLIISTRRDLEPSNGVYLFRNIGTNKDPLFDRGEWMGPGQKGIVVADINGDSAPDVVVGDPDMTKGYNWNIRSGYFDDVRRNRLSKFVPLELKQPYKITRDPLRYPVDWDGDGRIDLIVGVNDWTGYGWDNAFNEKGEWIRDRIHGYMFFHRNAGTNQQPIYEDPVQLTAGGKPIDLFGNPAPNPVDWFGRGRLDLIGGDFLDTITIFENVGTRTKPMLAEGKLLEVDGRVLKMDLCMLQPRVGSWHEDGRPSLVIGEEDGYVSFLENEAPRGTEPRLRPPRYLQQVEPYMKSGALSRPVSVDWNGDGKLDIVSGNTAGYLQYFENVGTREAPAFADRGYLEAERATIRIMAGPNGSIQGPVEAKWGYTQPDVADWDLDGLLDIVVNSIRGEVLWYRNTGTRGEPRLAAAQPIEVEWKGKPPKPAWLWWNPKGKQLVTQWRTTPKLLDWNGDGLVDLVMLDHEGYLSFFERKRSAGKLTLLPPQRIFRDAERQPLRMRAGQAGSSGRRCFDIADWDHDGDFDLIADMQDQDFSEDRAREFYAASIAWHENVGSNRDPILVYRGRIADRAVPGHNPSPSVADWTGDGKLDLIVGAQDGLFYFFDRNYINPTRPAGAAAQSGRRDE
jgi:hypothetical protein